MLVELTIAALQGVAQAVAERLIKGRDSSASIAGVMRDVATVRILAEESEENARQLHSIIAQVVERVDGLEIRSRHIRFRPTATAPTAESALLNLDLEISRLRLADFTANKAPSPGPSPHGSAVNMSQSTTGSTLDGLDDEISGLRDGRTQ